MAETDVKLGELRQNIAHLSEMSQDGWILKWGDAPQETFELVCRKANALQVSKIDALVSKAYEQARVQLS